MILYLYINDIQALTAQAVVLGADGHPINSANILNIQEDSFPEHEQLNLVIPAGWVTHLQVTLPEMKASQLRKALPYAVEEQSLSDVDTMHIALLQAESPQRVALIERQLLTEVLNHLAQFAITPDKVYSELSALSVDESTAHCLCHQQQALCQWGMEQFVCDLDNLPAMLAQAQQQTPMHTVQIETFFKTGMAIPKLPELDSKLTAHLASDYYTYHAKRLYELEPADLLQGKLAQRRALPKLPRLTKTAARLAIAVLSLFLLTPFTESLVLSLRLSSQTRQQTALYQQLHSQASLPANPRGRVLQELQRLRQAVSGDEFLTLLSYVAPDLSRDQAQLTALQYQQQQLVLSVEMDSLTALARFNRELKHRLRSHAIDVQQAKAVSLGNRVTAEITLKEAHR